MPDTKITALTAIGANPIIPSTFPIPMVDLTDTSMAASGTTKKVTVNQILGAGGTATLASATITGDLTVDTSTLKVDSANNRVGVGTASPADSLHIFGAGNALIEGTAGIYAKAITKVGAKSWQFGYRSGTLQYEIQEDGVERYTIGNGGTPHKWYIGASTAMTLDSSGLGVGGSPTSKLSVFAGADGDVGFFRGGSTRQLQIGTSATAGYLNVDNASAGFELRINGTARAYFDISGNVGIGVSTFGTSAAKVLGLANATAPTTSPAGMGQLYVEAGALKYRGSSGTVTTIANA